MCAILRKIWYGLPQLHSIGFGFFKQLNPSLCHIKKAFFLSSLSIGLQLYMWIIIIRALLSWVNPDPYNPIVKFLYSITEPVLYRVRNLLPMSGVGIDFSPIIVLLLIIFCQEFLVNSLHLMGQKLQGPP